MRVLRRWFITGLLVLAPAVITGYVLWFGFNLMDGFWRSLFVLFLGRVIPGAGALLTVVVTVAVGAVATHVVGRRLIHFGERVLERIPLVRGVYFTTRQIVDVFAGQHTSGFQRVVLVEYPRRGLYTLGFLTATHLPQAEQATGQEIWSVFVPTSPNPTSGWVVLVPREQCRVIPMAVEEAFRIIVSGGVLADGNRRPGRSAPSVTGEGRGSS